MTTTTTRTQEVHALGWEMPLIHRIFRHGFVELARIIGDVPPDATARAHAVAGHLAFTLDGLHVHHSTEDELLWPLLSTRTPSAELALAALEQQHTALAERIAAIRATAQAWAREPSASASSHLAGAVRALVSNLADHLDEEERVVVPLIAQHLTEPEWQAFGQEAFAKFEPRQRPIAMGQMIEVATPDEAARMLATLPVPVRLMWRLAGRRMYRRTMARVRGKKQPTWLRAAMRKAGPIMVQRYERSDGRRGGSAKGLPVMLITIAGRRSAALRTTSVAYLEYDGCYIVAGSGGGMAREPQWFRNLREADRVTIRVGADTHEATVRVTDRERRDDFWHHVVLERAPLFAKYEQKSARLIPLAVLTPAVPVQRQSHP
jgi:deazaflavin-dependent oxidoreductase (nitroreductase family)